jgi:hypothetical protein
MIIVVNGNGNGMAWPGLAQHLSCGQSRVEILIVNHFD